MGIDWFPGLSQIKSAFQAMCGDTEGARQTQLNFVKGCPIVSQVGALGAHLAGNNEYARESQEYFVKNVSETVDAVPGVGHVKGYVHYMCGDTEGGDNAMKSSSRSVGVIGGGIGGFVVGGPIGAVAGGIAAGTAMDGLITGIESGIKDEYVPNGHVDYATDAINGELDAGGYFDWTVTTVFDGVAGKKAGEGINKE